MTNTETTTCQTTDCANPATHRPVYDANPVPARRRQIGTVAICAPCQAATDRLNALIRRPVRTRRPARTR